MRRITPQPLEIGPREGFTPEKDIFGYADFGDSLANLLCNTVEPLTIVLDGKWGTGKSVFARQLAGHVRVKKGVMVIEFDAFGNDYKGDAFQAIASQIIKAASDTLAEDNPLRGELLESAKKVSKSLLGIGAKMALRAATLGALSSAAFDELGEDLSELVEGGVQQATDVLVDQVLLERLSGAQAEEDAFKAFRDVLEKLVATLRGQRVDEAANTEEIDTDETSDPAAEARVPTEASRELVVVIDELDRCKPNFALDLIEQIKHFFDIDGIGFLLITNLDQMTAAVGQRYGLGEDSGKYLDKFFHTYISLPEVDLYGHDRRKAYVDYLRRDLGSWTDDNNFTSAIREGLSKMTIQHDLSLRTLERMVTITKFILASTHSRSFRPPPLVLGLVLMNRLAPDLYKLAKRGSLSWEEVSEFLSLNVSEDGQPLDHFAQFWCFVTIEQLPEDEWAQRFRSGGLSDFDQRPDMLKSVCNQVDSFVDA